MKRFHEVLTGNAHACSLQLRIGEASEVLSTLNEPELYEGLSNECYTAEKTIGKRRIYLYYYQTLPLQAQQHERYAIIDFVGLSDA